MTSGTRCPAPVCADALNAAGVHVRVDACLPAVGIPIPFHGPFHFPNQIRGSHMNNIVYIVGAVVIILAVLSFFGFR